MTTFRCIVSADLFRRAYMATESASGASYYLHGVYIEPCPAGGAMLTATDGYKLVNLRDPRGFVQGAAIINPNASVLREMKGRKSDLPQVSLRGLPERVLMVNSATGAECAYIAQSALPYTEDGNEVEPRTELHTLFDKPDMRVIAAQFGSAEIDAQFPDWRRVLPDGDLGPVKTAFDAGHIKTLGAALCTGRAHQLTFASGPGEGAPTLVQALGSDVEGFGILMPCRVSQAYGLPRYIKEPEKAAA